MTNASESSPPNPGAQQPFLEHLRELRQRLIYCVIAVVICVMIGYVTFPACSDFLLKPLITGDTVATAYSPLESFATKIKFSMILGIIYALPIMLYQVFSFLVPALTSREKKYILCTVSVGILLFLFGLYYSYDLILPLCVEFFQSITQELGIKQEFRYSDTLMFVLQVMLAFAFMFQCPVIMFVLMFLGVVTRKTLLSNSRFVIVGAFLVSAVITPPDVISQVMLAVPLIILYFITLGIAAILRIG